MARFLFLSQFQPDIYNIGGPTRLVYDILRSCPAELDVVFCSPFVEVRPERLPGNISFSPWSAMVQGGGKKQNVKLWLLPKKMRECMDSTLDVSGYAMIISYPYNMSLVNFHAVNCPIVSIGMDSTSLLFLRAAIEHKGLLKWASMAKLIQTLEMEKRSAKLVSRVFTVGEADAAAYSHFFFKEANYIPHPVTDMISSSSHTAWDGLSRLRICFAGAMSRFYVSTLLDKLIDEIIGKKEYLANMVDIAFLGKGNQKYARRLIREGFLVRHERFVPSFENFLCAQDLLIAPLAVGAGTKNRVLTAIALGLDIIGTDIALENIYGVRDENLANTGKMMVEKLGLRLSERKLFSYDSQRLDRFREFHSIERWNSGFWRILMEDLR